MADDPRGARLAGQAEFVIRPAADQARLVLRGRAPALQAASAELGFETPERLRAQSCDGVTSLWLGPDEYLLLAGPDQEESLYARLEAALAPYAHSLVGVSDRQLGFELSGNPVAFVLNAGCPLDLELRAFPVGMCTRTLLGRAEIMLWRQTEHRFHLEVWRSFAPYVASFLELAARDG